MFFSKSCEYALRATMYLANIEEGQRVGIHIIAKDLELPADYLSKVMQILVRSKVISSAKGRNGGFYLSESELNAPLIRIVHAIDGKTVFQKCGLGMSDCSSTQPCPLHNDIHAYRKNLELALLNNSVFSMKDGIATGATFLVR